MKLPGFSADFWKSKAEKRLAPPDQPSGKGSGSTGQAAELTSAIKSFAPDAGWGVRLVSPDDSCVFSEADSEAGPELDTGPVQPASTSARIDASMKINENNRFITNTSNRMI
ncbi:MAG: hypothetical protein PHQ83_02620 [Eubacteriales bacterium]|nr:hypothetical protein [Eubacteriales bacterium]